MSSGSNALVAVGLIGAGAWFLFGTDAGKQIIGDFGGGGSADNGGGNSGGQSNGAPDTQGKKEAATTPSNYGFTQNTTTQDLLAAFTSNGIGGSVSTFSGSNYDSPQTFVTVSDSKKAQSISSALVAANANNAASFITLTGPSGSPVGGYDFVNQQSVTADRASSTVTNKKVTSLNSGGGSSTSTSTPKPTATSSPAQNYTPAQNYSPAPASMLKKNYSSVK